jgi:adenosylcobinamide-GDP ribazoletransferase
VVRENPRLHNLRLTAAFLTRIRISHGEQVALDRMARWFPLVGLLIGVVATAVYLSAELLFGPLVASVLAVLAAVLLTGGFHQDGLADAADGLVGGWTPEERLQILKDSRHGTYGVLALVVQVVLQVAALSVLPVTGGSIALLLMHSIARAVAVSTMRAGMGLSGGLGANYVAGVTKKDIVVAQAFAVVLAVGLAGWHGLVAYSAASLAAWFVVRYAIRRIGGIVGDVLGAAEQVAETAVLLVVVGFVNLTGFFGW